MLGKLSLTQSALRLALAFVLLTPAISFADISQNGFIAPQSCAAPGCAISDPAILSNGRYENYIPQFYDPALGWQNGIDQMNPTRTNAGLVSGVWSWSVAFYGVRQAWLINRAAAPNRITFLKDPTSPTNSLVARIEVDPGDHNPHSPSIGEDAQLVMMEDRFHKPFPVTPASGQEFYGISIKVPVGWVPPEKSRFNTLWGIFLQLHSPNQFASPPAFALTLLDKFSLQYCGGDVLEGGALLHYKPAVFFPFSDGSLAVDRWTEFMIDVKWTVGNDGHIVIYRRNKGENNWRPVLSLMNIATLQSKFGVSNEGLQHYWAAGYYRSPSPDVRNVLFLGPIVRGTNFQSVAAEAFGQK